jgi:uncharacterized protein
MQNDPIAKELPMEDALAAIRDIMSDGRHLEPKQPNSSERVAPRNVNAKPEDAGLLSREATASISSAVDKLTTSVKERQPSLEDVVREALRPMLKSWLDENLPGVVDRIVQVEIEKAIRGR